MLNLLGNLLHGVGHSLVAWRQRHRAYAELAALDDRSLADIGLSRSEIPYVLSQAAPAPKALRAPANSNVPRAA
jgi:uncharacterized protein YjiS (DUF1127 family)